MMKRLALGIASAAMLAGGIAGWWVVPGSRDARAAGPEAPLAAPVTVAPATRQDVPVFFDGLGAVQAFSIVQIKSQVSGTLVALPAHEGQEVRKGDVIAEIDPRPYQATLDQAMAQRQEDQAQLQGAQLDLKRYQSLAKSSFAPVQQVDDQQATVSRQVAAIAADSAAIETAQLNLGYCVIRAPIDGRVSLYQVDVGNLIEVASQTGIVSITQDKPIAVVFTLPERQLAKVQDARARGTVPVQVMSGNGQQQLAQGVLLTPNNTIDTTTGTISLKAAFDNKDDHLWPGQFVNARVRVDTLPDAVTIPELAVEHGPTGLFVYVVKPDQTVAVQPVSVGYQLDGRSVVTNGLGGGETVVVTGQALLSPGARVKATKAGPETADASGTPG